MEFIRGIIGITIWLCLMFVTSVFLLFSYLSVLFIGSLIFIYEEIKGKNYGWPEVSYGTQYFYDENGKSYKINHETNKFEEPLFALVPSVGISSLNTCPSKLKEYYKKPCLLALSLFGNDQRPGRSLIIYLLNEKLNKVHSIEKIFIRDDLKLRHFVTNSKNEIFEDDSGSIYVSADKKGIYKLSFTDFRN